MPNPTHDIILPIEGMTCGSCVSRVENALKKVASVGDVAVHLSNQQAFIKASKTVALKPLVEAVNKAGYRVPQSHLNWHMANISSARDTQQIEQTLGQIPGVIDATAHLATHQLQITYIPQLVSPTTLAKALEKIGYPPQSITPESPIALGTPDSRGHGSSSPHPQHVEMLNNPEELRENRRKLLFWDIPDWRLFLSLGSALVLTIPMMGELWGVHIHLTLWMQLLLASLVQFFGGYPFYRDSWRALRAGHSTMDTLVTIGTTAAYVLSLVLFFTPSLSTMGSYFESSAVVIALVLLGKRFEQRALRQTNRSVHALMNLWPQHAYQFLDGQLVEISPDDLQPQDKIVVRAFERIPADGVLIKGETTIDESSITGESLPVAKKAGDQVIGGSTNMGELIEVEVSASKNSGFLSRMIHYVQQAQMEKPPIQRLVDKISAIFVPIVLVIAFLTFLGWYVFGQDAGLAILHAIAVLVIACPCALGLATPTALTAGLGIGAKYGILVKNAHSLEQAKKIKVVIFDKTGTLTEGLPSITQITPNAGATVPIMMDIVYHIQKSSTHPLAQAVITWVRNNPLSPLSGSDPVVEQKIGKGLFANFGQSQFVLGTEQLLFEYGLDTGSLKAEALALEQQGHTISWLGQLLPQKKIIGFMAFQDQLRPTAAQAIKTLQTQGIITALISGDNPSIVALTAKKLGISIAKGRVLPEEKAAFLQEMRQQYGAVAMVGDGVNDAPALAKADLSIAISGGSDVAMNTADITLLNRNPVLVADILNLALLTQRKIWQNLFWAFIYNMVGIVLAASGLLSPMIAGMAMAFSSVSVITNALFLYRWKPSSSLIQNLSTLLPQIPLEEKGAHHV